MPIPASARLANVAKVGDKIEPMPSPSCSGLRPAVLLGAVARRDVADLVAVTSASSASSFR